MPSRGPNDQHTQPIYEVLWFDQDIHASCWTSNRAWKHPFELKSILLDIQPSLKASFWTPNRLKLLASLQPASIVGCTERCWPSRINMISDIGFDNFSVAAALACQACMPWSQQVVNMCNRASVLIQWGCVLNFLETVLCWWEGVRLPKTLRKSPGSPRVSANFPRSSPAISRSFSLTVDVKAIQMWPRTSQTSPGIPDQFNGPRRTVQGVDAGHGDVQSIWQECGRGDVWMSGTKFPMIGFLRGEADGSWLLTGMSWHWNDRRLLKLAN